MQPKTNLYTTIIAAATKIPSKSAAKPSTSFAPSKSAAT
jgi:hypothetical protein